MKMAFILLDGKARPNILLSTFSEEIIDMDSIVILLSQNKDLLTIEKNLSSDLRLLIIYSQNIDTEQYSSGRALVHELNNSLAIIYSSIFISKKLIKKEVVNMEKVEKMVFDIGSTSENMQKIIKGYAAELEGNTVSYEMELNDLIYYIENTIVPYLLTNKVQYNLNINMPENTTYKLKTIGIHMSQIIINLVKNATESVRESDQNDKQVSLNMSVVEDFIVVEIFDNGPGVPESDRVEIFDNGPGVPESDRVDIFKQNFTTKGDKGNGIGLYICKKNIRKSGGTMTYDDTYTDGAKFIVKLPIVVLND